MDQADLINILVILIVGGIAGWLASLIVRGGDGSAFGNIVIGVIGAFVGYFVFDLLEIAQPAGIHPVLWFAIIAVSGAVVLLILIGIIRRL